MPLFLAIWYSLVHRKEQSHLYEAQILLGVASMLIFRWMVISSFGSWALWYFFLGMCETESKERQNTEDKTKSIASSFLIVKSTSNDILFFRFWNTETNVWCFLVCVEVFSFFFPFPSQFRFPDRIGTECAKKYQDRSCSHGCFHLESNVEMPEIL